MKDLFRQAWQEAAEELGWEMNLIMYFLPSHETNPKIRSMYKRPAIKVKC